MFDKLWPRGNDNSWIDFFQGGATKDMAEILNQKLNANMLGSPTDEIRTVCKACSGINHSFPSNCAMRTVLAKIGRPPEKNVVPVAFCYVVAKRDIAKDEEITITYTTEAPKDHPFILTPTENEVEKEAMLEDVILRDNRLWTGIARHYLENKKWIGTTCRHKLMTEGMFLVAGSAGNCMVMTLECSKRHDEKQRQSLVDMYTERKRTLTGKKVDMEEIGEPGSAKRRDFENEAIFQWEWETTTRSLLEFDFMRE